MCRLCREANGGWRIDPVSVIKTTAAGSKMINRRLHRRDDAQTGCHAIDLVSYLEGANEKLRLAVARLMRETAALQQELEKKESRGHAPEAGACRQASNDVE
jgi:hypothetical protein